MRSGVRRPMRPKAWKLMSHFLETGSPPAGVAAIRRWPRRRVPEAVRECRLRQKAPITVLSACPAVGADPPVQAGEVRHDQRDHDGSSCRWRCRHPRPDAPRGRDRPGRPAVPASRSALWRSGCSPLWRRMLGDGYWPTLPPAPSGSPGAPVREWASRWWWDPAPARVSRPEKSRYLSAGRVRCGGTV